MKEKFLTIFFVILTAFLVVLLTNFFLVAKETSDQGVTVLATVLPQRYIIVDTKLRIIQVLSNTADDVRPAVFLGSADGKELPYSESIQRQYEDLKPVLDFSRPGVVFQRDPRPFPAALKSIFGSFSFF